MSKKEANKGFLKELKSTKTPVTTKEQFTYSNPVVTPQRVKKVGFNSRHTRPVKTPSFCDQQATTLNTNKGQKNEE
jgi:hypothetical protein